MSSSPTPPSTPDPEETVLRYVKDDAIIRRYAAAREALILLCGALDASGEEPAVLEAEAAIRNVEASKELYLRTQKPRRSVELERATERVRERSE